MLIQTSWRSVHLIHVYSGLCPSRQTDFSSDLIYSFYFPLNFLFTVSYIYPLLLQLFGIFGYNILIENVLLLCCWFASTENSLVMSGWSVNLTTLFLNSS